MMQPRRIAPTTMTVALLRRSPGNLPPERTSFVGRTAEIAAVEQLVASGERLITLVGGAGAGKTRLAKRAAARLSSSAAAEAGVWICDLSEARGRGDVLAIVSATLDAPLAHGTSADVASAQLGHALAARPPLLLVLDNFERVAAEAAQTVGEWHARASSVTFLVTSRARLRLEGEAVVEVGPMRPTDAIVLFEERARRVLPAFRAEEDTEALVELVRRLDHGPLGIELAAARVKVLPPRKLLDRMTARIDVLRSAHRDASARHATLRSALDGSWELLEPWEKQALAQCSVFHGGFTLEAAEAVLSLAGAPPGYGAMDAVEALDENSLLVRDEARAPAEPRFRLFELVREYASDKLSSTEAEAAQALQRHEAFYLARAERELAASLAPWASVAAEGVLREIDNLSAIARRSQGRSPVTLVRAAVCLDAALLARGPADTHRRLLDLAIATCRAEPGVPAPLRARLHAGSAHAHRVRGELAEARADLEHALGSVDQGDPAEVSLLQVSRAHLELDAGRISDSRAAAGAALDNARAAGDRPLELVALHTLARVHVDADELEAGRALCHEAMPLSRRLEVRLIQSRLENLLGVIAAREARLEEAEQHYTASVELARDAGDAYLANMVSMNLADVQVRRGDHHGARVRYREALAITQQLGFLRVQGLVASHLGLLEHDLGNLDEARSWHARALGIHREVGNVRSEAFGLEVFALLALEERRLDDAAASLERALELTASGGLEAVTAAGASCLASVVAHRGRAADAARALAAARAAASVLARPEPRGLVDLHEAVVWIAEAHGAGRAATQERVAAARRRHAEAAEVARHSARCRIVRRILAGLLGAAAGDATDRLMPRDQVAPAGEAMSVEVGPEARWFRRGGEAPVDLSRRRALRLLVERLAQLWFASPGDTLSLDELFAAGWPGERASPAAAHRRVYTAIGLLRDLGLRDVLIRRDQGYLLSPDVPLVRSSSDPD